jgi:vacuolar protein sorting-associated protein 13A/C
MRENLSTDQQDLCLGVHLMESPYSDVRAISVTSVGEHLHVLYPKLQMVSDRIVCDIRLRDQRKVITIRSPLVIKNSTQVAVQLALLGDESGKTWTLEPNSSRAIPLWQTLDAQLVARPDPSLGFTWSKEDLYWQDLLKGTRALSCPPIASDSDSTFYFQAFADYDKNIPLTRIYPYMTVNLSAPLEIVNLLPFDFTYRLYSKEAKKDWTNELKKGESSPVHVVQLRQLLLLSVHPKQAGYDRTDFSVVNTKSGDDFKLEDTLTTHHRDGQKLKLKIHYM